MHEEFLDGHEVLELIRRINDTWRLRISNEVITELKCEGVDVFGIDIISSTKIKHLREDLFRVALGNDALRLQVK